VFDKNLSIKKASATEKVPWLFYLVSP